MSLFAFNTLIGQVTPIAIQSVGYRFFFLFIACDFAGALFFWTFLPETAHRPLEEMSYLFTNAPLFVPRMKKADFRVYDLERRVSEAVRASTAGDIDTNGERGCSA